MDLNENGVLPPKHVAVIMDGNGRWAKQRLLPRSLGHKAGVKTVKEIVKASKSIGIEVLTLYAFSTENWKRPESEIKALFDLLLVFIKQEMQELADGGVKLRILGDMSAFPINIRTAVEEVCEKTKDNKDLQLNIALNYGGRQELIYAFKKLIEKGIGEPTQEDISSFLYTCGQPDPDLLIRTSGELRVSNFLLWQIAYSEIYITDKLWPDFTGEDLKAAVADYQKRQRRFGAI